MPRLISLIIIIGLTYCSKPFKREAEIDYAEKGTLTLEGKVFTLGPSREACKIYAECDCCTSELLFLDKTNFVLVDICLEENIWTTGTYDLDSDSLKISFRQLAVYNFGDVMNPDAKPIIKSDTLRINPILFLVDKCENGDPMLVGDQSDYKYGLKDIDLNEASAIRSVLESEEWTILKNK